jgi:hypothetical protein
LGAGSKPWSLLLSAIAPKFFHQSSLLPRACGLFQSGILACVDFVWPKTFSAQDFISAADSGSLCALVKHAGQTSPITCGR